MSDQPLYNSRIIKTYIEYIHDHYPELNINSILDYADITIYQVNDGGHWFNQNQVDRFQEVLVKETENPNIAMEVGRYSTFSKASGAMTSFLTGFITPSAAYRFMGKMYAQVSRSCVIETRSLKINQAEIKVTLQSGVEEKPYQCANRLGTFESISKILTGKLPKIDHPVCLHKGGDCCQYIITWESSRSSVWKKISVYSALLAFFIWLILLIFCSGKVAMFFDSIALIMVFIPLIWSMVLEKKELKNTLENSGNTAETTLNQVNALYNQALLIKDIGQYASSILDTEQLLKYFMSTLEKNLEFSRGMVLLANSDRTLLSWAEGFGYSPEHEEFLKKLGFSLENPNSRGMFVVCFRKQIPFLINNVSEIEKDLSPKSLAFARKLGSRSFICVPIIFEGRSEGILAVDNLKTNRELNQTDISLLMGIAPQIGISINNARMYERLQEREKRFRILAESAPDIIFIMDVEGTLLYINPIWNRILEHRPDDVVGKNLVSFVEEEDVNRLKKLLKEIIKNKTTMMNVLLTVKSRTGIEHDFSFNCAPNIDEQGHVDSLVGIFKDMTDLKRSEVELKKSYEKLEMAMSGTISVISLISESRDPYTAGHQRGVADLAVAIAREMGLSEERLKMIHMAGLIHDIGKINVPAEILSKPGKLTPVEFSLIKSHPETGYNILKQVDFIPTIAQVVYQHHEKMDGSGYPRMISGNEIILEARIITVADVVEAMANHRPYRPALGIEKALDEIHANRGVTYDPDAVDACIALFTTHRFHFGDSDMNV
jgi:PAS domain S-box-containing protein/putative nucleotidyltransferase with HDIG domain